MKKIMFVAPFAGPPYIEAWRKNVKTLSLELDAIVFASSQSYDQLNKTPPNFILIVRRNKYIRYLLHVLYVWKCSKNYDLFFLELIPYRIHFYFFLLFLHKNKCIYRLNSNELFDNNSGRLLKKFFLSKVSRNLGYVVVPDENTKQNFVNGACKSKNIIITRPGVDLKRFKPAKPRKASDFKLMMASVPRIRYPWWKDWKVAFHSKGLLLLLDTIKQLEKINNIEVNLIWRGDFYNEILGCIKERNISCVKVINEEVDIYEYYKSTDATILPVCSTINTPSYPNSIMESIAVGRPVIVSKYLPISRIIEITKCGISTEPSVEGLSTALETLITKYELYQNRCLMASKRYFDYKNNVKGLRNILLGKEKLINGF